MLDGIYATAAGLEAYTKRQEVLAINLANVNTVGFKRNITDFETILERIAGYEDTESLRANVDIDFSEGNLEHTGSSLDIAIDGKGFFTIETGEGLRYTRNGQFQLSSSGEIVTSSGDRLLGSGGPLLISRGGSEIRIDTRGTVKVDDRVIGDLLITNFEQPSLLIPKDRSLFEAPITAIPDTTYTDFKIAQGYLERANVNVVTEMVTMIENMRNFEASANVMKNFSDTMESLISSLINV
jgi:flagellar basal-body rod protein FlgF